jgi:hypothetical protein
VEARHRSRARGPAVRAALPRVRLRPARGLRPHHGRREPAVAPGHRPGRRREPDIRRRQQTPRAALGMAMGPAPAAPPGPARGASHGGSSRRSPPTSCPIRDTRHRNTTAPGDADGSAGSRPQMLEGPGAARSAWGSTKLATPPSGPPGSPTATRALADRDGPQRRKRPTTDDRRVPVRAGSSITFGNRWTVDYYTHFRQGQAGRAADPPLPPAQLRPPKAPMPATSL